MSRNAFILLFLLPVMAFADAKTDAMKAREQALQALNGFNPGAVLKDYTVNPKESALAPTESNNALTGLGNDALKKNQAAFDVFQNALTREKIKPNPASPEMRYAETLLENPDSVLDGACFREKGACETKSETKNCIDTVVYKPVQCQRKLNVQVKSVTQRLSRMISSSVLETSITFNLTSCPPRDWYCTKDSLATISQPCDALQVNITRANKALTVSKQPTCNDPTVTVQLTGGSSIFIPFQISLTEYSTEDFWQGSDCNALQTQVSKGACILDKSNQCLEPDAVKVINGISVKRPCWGEQLDYQCSEINSSTCTALISQGCSQIASACTNARNNFCERYSQTFQCLENFCMPEKTVCPGKMACTDGECDSSSSETSDDIQEGLARLGALAGVAGDAATNQVKSGVPAIFTGKAKECEKYPLGFRDCCTDSGWGDWVQHCPADLKELQRAKHENRVVYLGHYKKHKLGSRHYAYCVFPSKLGGIVQIQGRGGQLRISYGSAKEPNCRGLTPEEMERINFAALDLSSIQQELASRMALPANGKTGASNEAHIEQLNREGRSHD